VGRATVRPAARRDLIQHFAYIGEKAGVNGARRFLVETRHSFTELAQNPHLGALRQTAKFPALRMWRVRHFEKYLIFYQPVTSGVEIERVIHAAQDYTRLLSLESPRS
jgi:toxin ParE1/3/4